jgi:phage/plasmid-like protein (TIGR03299 family)
MAHNFESGFVVREPAWHGLATVLDDYPGDWSEARRLAGLDWEPVEEPVFARAEVTGLDGDPFGNGHNPLVKLDGYKAVRRSDTGSVIAVHADTYEVFPNAELGPLVEALIEEPDVQYETAGVLKKGAKVWVMVRLKEPFEIPGDPRGTTLSRLAIQNSHDGSSALRAQRLQTRIVCDNTSHAADREAGRHGMEFTFRHTKNMRDRIEDAKAALAGLRSDRERYVEWAHELLGIKITPRQRELFVTEFVPMPVAQVVSDRVIANVEKARQEVRKILDSPTTVEVQGTAYGLVGAAIEYLDHARGFRSKETHFTRSYLNREPLKRKAEKLAREVAAA